MKILAIDTSGLVGAVAVSDGDILLSQFSIQYKTTHSEILMPMLDDIREKVHLDLKSIDAIAVAMGPGSFTGLRICVATAKGLGLATGLPMVGVKTLEGLAYIFEGTDCLVCPMMDARRNQVYTGVYAFEKKDAQKKEDGSDKNAGSVEDAKSAVENAESPEYCLKVLEDQQAVAIEEILEKVNALGRKVIFLGDGVPVHKKKIEELVKVDYRLAPAHRLYQSASALGRCALSYIREGRVCSATDLLPEYLRLSQAEREKLARGESIVPEE